jgi:hypothetical protein
MGVLSKLPLIGAVLILILGLFLAGEGIALAENDITVLPGYTVVSSARITHPKERQWRAACRKNYKKTLKAGRSKGWRKTFAQTRKAWCTETDYTLRATVRNGGTAAAHGLKGAVTATGPGVEIVDGDVDFGDVEAGRDSTPEDTFRVRLNGLTTPGTAPLTWQLEYTLAPKAAAVPPIANAGAHRTVDGGTVVTLDGRQSHDPDGSIIGYLWEQTGGPVVALAHPTTATPSFTAPAVTQPTDLSFRLTVTDNGGATASATVVITVAPPPAGNQMPAGVQLVGVSSLSGDKLTAEWLPARDDQTPPESLVYTLHVSTAPGFTPTGATAKLARTGMLSGTVEGLTPATRYYVKITAEDPQGLESWSNELGVVTAAVVAQPTPATVHVQDAAQAPEVTDTSVTYTESGTPPQVGEYLAGAVGAGYLRRVAGVQTRNNQVIAATEHASLNELFQALEINAAVKLEPVPEQATASAGLVQSPQAAGEHSVAWPETGLTLIDANPASSPAPMAAVRQALPATGQSLIVDGDRQTRKGEYLDFTGPAYWALTPGQLGTFTLKADVMRPKTSFGRNVPLQICTIRLTNFTHRDPAKRAIIAADRAAGQGLQVGSPVIGDAEQSATLNVVWQPEAKYVHDGGLPYYATFEVIVDEKADGCADSMNWWAETLELEIPIYITMGGMPSREKKSLTFSGGFTVRNDATFTVKPEFEIGARIENAQLREATLAVNADLEFLQELTIQADGAATLDQTLELLAPRKFIKVFAAGPAPVVVSGEFAIKLKVQGQAKGKVNLREALRYAFPEARFGLRYEHGTWSEIRNFEPEYKFSLDGEGDAGADLTLTLVPDLQIHFYDAASGRMLVEPYLYAQAGIHGQFKYQDGSGGYLTDLDYWFTGLQAGGGLNLRLYAGLHIFDYNLASYPAGVTINEIDKFRFLKVIDKTPIAGIPALSAQADFNALPPGDSRAILVQGGYQNVANPFKALFGAGPDAYITFAKWTAPKVVTTKTGWSVDPNGDGGDGRYWLRYTQPGTYEVRLGGHSSLGWFVRQVASPIPFTITLTDDDADGMVDQWEALWHVYDPGGDPDGDGITNLQEFQAGTRPTAANGLPGGTGRLNDTGVTLCGDYAYGGSGNNNNNLDCGGADPDGDPIPPGQDAVHGRDALAAAGALAKTGGGHAGFDFTRIDGDGNELPESAAEWSCVRDNVTGLMWEVKTDDGGLHDWDWTYTWYEPDGSRNGGFAGYQNGGSCGETGGCDTHAYVEAVNAAGWCGHDDWRMPTVDELSGIASLDRHTPAIDAAWFPRTKPYADWFAYWSSSPVAGLGGSAWYVDFGNGSDYWLSKSYGSYVRLVRGGQ